MKSIALFLEQRGVPTVFSPTKQLLRTPTSRMLTQRVNPNSAAIKHIHTKSDIESDKERQSVNVNSAFARRTTDHKTKLVGEKLNKPIIP